jgi:hypothetical protein
VPDHDAVPAAQGGSVNGPWLVVLPCDGCCCHRQPGRHRHVLVVIGLSLAASLRAEYQGDALDDLLLRSEGWEA